jgi:hypothetical protein
VSWTNRLILGFVVLVALVVGWFIATAFLPRWWAQRVGAVADGGFTAGIFAGLTCGAVLTAIPLALLLLTVRRRARWGARLIYLGLAVLTAWPNLTTLGIVLGSNAAVHAGRRTMDVEAPGFRGATLIGAVIGVLLVIVARVSLFTRRRRSAELVRLRSQLHQRDGEATGTSPHE